MKRMKRMASTLLAGIMALSLLLISSLAADSTGNDIQEMVVDGVTSSTSETTFSPDNHCTREQMVTVLYRLFEK